MIALLKYLIISDIFIFAPHRQLNKDNMYHVPCLGHVINLAVQAILGPQGLDDSPPENNNLHLDEDEDQAATEPATTWSPLQKMRKGIVKIR